MEVEEKILKAAREEFLALGFGGARMHSIAARAGVNKALLHYYFRSKEKLYAAVFDGADKEFADLSTILDAQETTLPEKINLFVIRCLDLHLTQPADFRLYFQKLASAEAGGLRANVFLKQLSEGQALGLLKRTSPESVLLALYSLCFFPLLLPEQLQLLMPTLPEGTDRELLRSYYEAIPKQMMESIRA